MREMSHTFAKPRFDFRLSSSGNRQVIKLMRECHNLRFFIEFCTIRLEVCWMMGSCSSAASTQGDDPVENKESAQEINRSLLDI